MKVYPHLVVRCSQSDLLVHFPLVIPSGTWWVFLAIERLSVIPLPASKFIDVLLKTVLYHTV